MIFTIDLRGEIVREKKNAQETNAQIEFGVKTEKVATKENVTYQLISKEK